MLFEDYFDTVYTRYYILIKGYNSSVWYFVRWKTWDIPDDEYYYEEGFWGDESDNVRDEYKNRIKEGDFWIITNDVYTGKIRSKDRKYGLPYNASGRFKSAWRNGKIHKLQGVRLSPNIGRVLENEDIRVIQKTGGKRMPVQGRRDFLFKLYAEILQAVGIGNTVPLSKLTRYSKSGKDPRLSSKGIFSDELHKMYRNLKQTEKPNKQGSYGRSFTSFKDRFYRLLHGLKQLGMIELTEEPKTNEIFITPLKELGELQDVASDEAFYDITTAIF